MTTNEKNDTPAHALPREISNKMTPAMSPAPKASLN
jgi:hypothetical protein